MEEHVRYPTPRHYQMDDRLRELSAKREALSEEISAALIERQRLADAEELANRCEFLRRDIAAMEENDNYCFRIVGLVISAAFLGMVLTVLLLWWRSDWSASPPFVIACIVLWLFGCVINLGFTCPRPTYAFGGELLCAPIGWFLPALYAFKRVEWTRYKLAQLEQTRDQPASLV